ESQREYFEKHPAYINIVFPFSNDGRYPVIRRNNIIYFCCPANCEDNDMKITFESYGLTASVVISSSIFESRKHQHIVDAVKLKAPEVTVTTHGLFRIRTTLTTTHGLFRIRTTLTTTHLSACRVYDMALKEYNQCSS
ncbi:hypothetical protein ACRV7S_004946, partial [Escherichia coli]